jgi:hypothetical protein
MTGDVNRLTDDALDRLRTASERGLITSGPRMVVEERLRDIAVAIRDHATEHARIRGDHRLSETGRREDHATLYEATQERLTGLVHDITRRVDAAIARARTRAEPVPSDVRPELLEARLGNARTDALMVLDAVPEDELHTALADLAENGSATMRHLILATDWPSLYLRKRDAATADALWANRKPALMPLVLDEDGQAALHTLTAEPDLRAVSTIARHLQHLWADTFQPRDHATA